MPLERGTRPKALRAWSCKTRGRGLDCSKPSVQGCNRSSTDHNASTALLRPCGEGFKVVVSVRGAPADQRGHSRARTGRRRHARYVVACRHTGAPTGCAPVGRRSRQSRPRTGKPCTWRRAAGGADKRRWKVGVLRTAATIGPVIREPSNAHHWRAGCLQPGTSGSAGGRGKRAIWYLACGLPYGWNQLDRRTDLQRGPEPARAARRDLAGARAVGAQL